MSFATSIDVLAMGFSLGLLYVNIWFPALFVFVITYLASALGLMTRKRFHYPKIYQWADIIGGFILIVIGAKVVISHILDHGILS